MISWLSSARSNGQAILFLDRDGVVNVDSPDYIKRWREFHFYPDALEAVRWLNGQSVDIVLVSNQSALSRGILTWDDFWDVHHRMVGHIREAGGEVLGAFYCPHHPRDGCACRKPAPGLILAAAETFRTSAAGCFMIGNRGSDVEAATRAGCTGVLLNRPGEADPAREKPRGTLTDLCYSTLVGAVTALFGGRDRQG